MNHPVTESPEGAWRFARTSVSWCTCSDSLFCPILHSSSVLFRRSLQSILKPGRYLVTFFILMWQNLIIFCSSKDEFLLWARIYYLSMQLKKSYAPAAYFRGPTSTWERKSALHMEIIFARSSKRARRRTKFDGDDLRLFGSPEDLFRLIPLDRLIV